MFDMLKKNFKSGYILKGGHFKFSKILQLNILRHFNLA